MFATEITGIVSSGDAAEYRISEFLIEVWGRKR
jgi:hypothetical protein